MSIQDSSFVGGDNYEGVMIRAILNHVISTSGEIHVFELKKQCNEISSI
ncbi:hypothetical protein [Fulvivirga ligni]|nr:hypothetical protein [Fulvivirga ligni]UII24251.1 hypothetical protein LVD16_13600 [Fulvivirga ligni]